MLDPIANACPVCKGVGVVARPPKNGDSWYPLGTHASTVISACPICARDGRLGWLAKHSGLKPAERQNTLDSFMEIQSGNYEHVTQRRKARALIERAIHDKAGLFTFWGDFGSGKTLSLQIIINELRQADMREGYYAPFAVVIDHLRQLFATNQDSSTYWDRLLSVPVLALDEVSRFDDGRAWIRDRLFVLADTRYRMRHSHLTIFATNANPNAALPTTDAVGYLFSRMREGELCELRGDVRAVARTMA